jgi:hypothetical protein
VAIITIPMLNQITANFTIKSINANPSLICLCALSFDILFNNSGINYEGLARIFGEGNHQKLGDRCGRGI